MSSSYVLDTEIMILLSDGEATMFTKSTWNAYTVLRIFYPCSVSEAETRMQATFPPYKMLDKKAGPLAIWKSITYPNRASNMPYTQHCFKGRGFVVRL